MTLRNAGFVFAAVNPNVFTAFFAGVISFLSPCVLPVVPGYLSLITGLSMGEMQEARRVELARIAWNTVLFMVGFGVVFVALFLGATALGDAIFDNQRALEQIAGGLVMLMALYLAGSQLLTLPSLYPEARFHPHLARFGPFAAPVAGAAFGLGWSPCIGPILGAVMGIAATEGQMVRGASLLIAYTLGLGVPFLIVGLGFGKLAGTLAWFKRHSRAITLVSAAVLFAFGLLILTGNFERMNSWLSDFAETIHMDWLFKSTV